MCEGDSCCKDCKDKSAANEVQTVYNQNVAKHIQDIDTAEHYTPEDPRNLFPSDRPNDHVDTNMPTGSLRKKRIDTKPMAPWIYPEDHTPLKLAVSLYSEPLDGYDGYILFAISTRSGAWYNCDTETVVVGLRGTSVGKEGFGKDLLDDKVSYYFSSNFFTREFNSYTLKYKSLSRDDTFKLLVLSLLTTVKSI